MLVLQKQISRFDSLNEAIGSVACTSAEGEITCPVPSSLLARLQYASIALCISEVSTFLSTRQESPKMTCKSICMTDQTGNEKSDPIPEAFLLDLSSHVMGIV